MKIERDRVANLCLPRDEHSIQRSGSTADTRPTKDFRKTLRTPTAQKLLRMVLDAAKASSRQTLKLLKSVASRHSDHQTSSQDCGPEALEPIGCSTRCRTSLQLDNAPRIGSACIRQRFSRHEDPNRCEFLPFDRPRRAAAYRRHPLYPERLFNWSTRFTSESDRLTAETRTAN